MNIIVTLLALSVVGLLFASWLASRPRGRQLTALANALTLDNTFDKTKTINSRRQRFDFTPTGGAVEKISCRMMDLDSQLQTQTLVQPSATDDVNYEVDEVEIECKETITLVDIEDIDTVIAELGGLNKLLKGTGKGYIKDPRDASTAVVKYSITGAAGAAFACSIRRPDGPIRIGGQDFSKTSLVIRNLSGAKLVFNAAAAAPDGSA